MALPDSQSVYVDSNADGTVERVKAEYSGNKCQVEVFSCKLTLTCLKYFLKNHSDQFCFNLKS